MARTRSMTRNQNHDDVASSSSRKRRATNGGVAPCSDLDHNLLFLVMMQLGLIDFLAFGGVCKSWRSLALNNKKIFMASRPPMSMRISNRPYKKDCYLEDFEGRRFKTILPHAAGRICFGISCGYLILFRRKTKNKDFWLVNPITRHELHFPCFRFNVGSDPTIIRCILVFSPSVSRWVFLVLRSFANQVWFSIEGTQEWNCVSSTFPMIDLHAFKGKIYTIHMGCRVYEMRLNPYPKLTLLQTMNFPKPVFVCPEFLSSSENLYVTDCRFKDSYDVYQLDFEEMKWVSSGKILEECAFFINGFKYSAAFRSEVWVDHWLLYERCACFFATVDTGRNYRLLLSGIWYFPNDCLNKNRLDE
ncbi:hypothetical protein Lser_V15G16129 [Lactuca serriola]